MAVFFVILQKHCIDMKNLAAILTAWLTLTLCGCDSGTDRPTLAVSVEPQRALLEGIVGDRYRVVTLLGPGANPETFEPTASTMASLNDSKAYFYLDALPFEHKIEQSMAKDLDLVDVSKGITPLYGTHGHEGHEGHSHGNIDPHLWTSVVNARRMARNMYDKVVVLDPDGKDYYTARYNALDARLDSLDRSWAGRLSAAQVRAFAVWHPSLSYLARDYGLEQISVGYENKEASAPQLARVIDEARGKGVKVFFFQKEYDSRQAGSLNASMGTRLVTVNPLDYDWESQLGAAVDALAPRR